MKKIIMIALVSLFINTNIIYAECSTKDTEYFKNIEDKYQITYNFDKESRKYILTLTYEDIDLFTYEIVGDGMDEATLETQDKKLIINNLPSGDYTIYIVGNTNSCSDIFKKEELTLPKYNQYAYDEACNGIEEFVLCSPTYDKELDYKTFISRVNSYKKSKENIKTIDSEEDEENTLLEWLKYNYIYIIYIVIGIVILSIIALIIKLIYKHERKRRRLE